MEQAIDYSAYVERPTDDKFAQLAELVQKQRDAEAAVLAAEVALKKAQEDLRKVRETELPEFMEQQLGLTEVKLRDGTPVKIDETVRASITKANAPRAFAWIRDEAKAPHLIKHVIKIEFAKGEDEQAKKLHEILEENKFQADDNESVHPQTLSAWVRERLEAGALPDDALELLGVHRQKFAKIG